MYSSYDAWIVYDIIICELAVSVNGGFQAGDPVLVLDCGPDGCDDRTGSAHAEKFPGEAFQNVCVHRQDAVHDSRAIAQVTTTAQLSQFFFPDETADREGQM